MTNERSEFPEEYGEYVEYGERSEHVGEYQYLNLVRKVLDSEERKTRNSVVKSLFNYNMTFDMKDGFPLLTTRKMFYRGIIEEMLFFLSGNTDTKILEKKGINIWAGNTSREFMDNNHITLREGLMGALYGYQWRFFNSEYDTETGLPKNNKWCPDQIMYVIETIKKDPFSRRILMTCYNPEQVGLGVLYPCHDLLTQFYVREVENKKYLDMFTYNRSSDVFLGLPFNITGSALLLHIIANLSDTLPGILHISGGDAHIYQNHYEACVQQLSRKPYPFPILNINKKLILDNLSYNDFEIINYNYHPPIRGEMVI